MQQKIYAGIALVSALALVLLALPSPSSTEQLPGADFMRTLANTEDAVLLDVRTPEEFAEGYIPGAINLNFNDASFASRAEQLDPLKKYFVYCRSGNRSAQAIETLRASGITVAYELSGGLVGNVGSVPLVQATNSSEDEYVVDPADLVSPARLMGSDAATPSARLSEAESKGLVRMREEEKLARDVYTTLGSQWNMRIFSNISASEQTHMDAMQSLLKGYGIKDPVSDDTIGSFTAPEMQQFYTSYTTKGSLSLLDALAVGAAIEEMDIRDIEVLKKGTTQADILTTYNHLQRGSRNHLRAFMKNIQAKGGTYTPQYLSQAEFDAVIATPQETGPR